MSFKTSRAKFIFLSAVAVAVIAVASLISHVAITDLIDQKEELHAVGEIQVRHMNGDMMHDAMRGDVYFALSALAVGNRGDVQAALEDFKTHGAGFTAALEENKKALTGEEGYEEGFKKLESLLATYKQSGESVISGALADVQDGGSRARATLKTFNDDFSALEEQQSQVIDMLSKRADTITESGADRTLRDQWLSLTAALIASLFSIAVPVVATILVFKPQGVLTAIMQSLSYGDTTVQVPYADREDEMGTIARTLEVFKANDLERRALQKTQEQQKSVQDKERRAAMTSLADGFESSIKVVVDTVASAATEMDATVRGLKDRTHMSVEKMGELVMGIGGATQNVETVAGAATELSSSIQEISSQVSRASVLTGDAVEVSQQADRMAADLSTAAERIGGVIGMIDDITAKINLLSLNATIEAARAGEAGKGFAVVAGEVKTLAGQTTQATAQIQQQVNLIQGAAADTVRVIADIKTKIEAISGITSSIAAAVEEQGMATQEIARNVSEAAEITRTISHGADEVRGGALSTGGAVEEMISAVSELSHQSEALRTKVAGFLNSVRAS